MHKKWRSYAYCFLKDEYIDVLMYFFSHFKEVEFIYASLYKHL